MPYILAKTTQASGWLQRHMNNACDIIAGGLAGNTGAMAAAGVSYFFFYFKAYGL